MTEAPRTARVERRKDAKQLRWFNRVRQAGDLRPGHPGMATQPAAFVLRQASAAERPRLVDPGQEEGLLALVVLTVPADVAADHHVAVDDAGTGQAGLLLELAPGRVDRLFARLDAAPGAPRGSCRRRGRATRIGPDSTRSLDLPCFRGVRGRWRRLQKDPVGSSG
jgi:hypothetical protein